MASANRLGTHRIDLYQIHQPGRLIRNDTIIADIRALQRAGVIGAVGVSNGSVKGWLAAESALGGRVLSNQVSYSLVARSAERDGAAVCRVARSYRDRS